MIRAFSLTVLVVMGFLFQGHPSVVGQGKGKTGKSPLNGSESWDTKRLEFAFDVQKCVYDEKDRVVKIFVKAKPSEIGDERERDRGKVYNASFFKCYHKDGELLGQVKVQWANAEDGEIAKVKLSDIEDELNRKAKKKEEVHKVKLSVAGE